MQTCIRLNDFGYAETGAASFYTPKTIRLDDRFK